jgi:hypothetical protein
MAYRAEKIYVPIACAHFRHITEHGANALLIDSDLDLPSKRRARASCASRGSNWSAIADALRGGRRVVRDEGLNRVAACYRSTSFVGVRTDFGCRSQTGSTSSGRGTPSACAIPWSVLIFAATLPASIWMIDFRCTPDNSASRSIDMPCSRRRRAMPTPRARRSGTGAGTQSTLA